MTYQYLGNYKGFAIEKRDGTYNAIAWDAGTNCSKVFYTAKTEKGIERAIDKGCKS